MHWSLSPEAEKVKEKIRRARANQIMKPRTPESRARVSKIMKGNHNLPRGKNHWNWQGGITPANRLVRTSSEYKTWREAVFKRDKYTCTQCAATHVVLNADHIKPFSKFPELRFDLSNGRTLCEPCHRKTDTYARKGRAIPVV